MKLLTDPLQNEIDELINFAEREQVGYGYHDGVGGRVPTIDGSANVNKR